MTYVPEERRTSKLMRRAVRLAGFLVWPAVGALVATVVAMGRLGRHRRRPRRWGTSGGDGGSDGDGVAGAARGGGASAVSGCYSGGDHGERRWLSRRWLWRWPFNTIHARTHRRTRKQASTPPNPPHTPRYHITIPSSSTTTTSPSSVVW